MPRQTTVQHTLKNGLTVLVEHLPAVRSAAVTLMVPGGACHEKPGKNGTSALLCELMMRGAGDLDSRALSMALDNLGIQHNLSPGWFHLNFSAATVATRLPDALRLIAEILLRPRLEPEQFAMCLEGREQVLRSIEDEPKQKLMIELRRRCYAPPWNRPVEGSLNQLRDITAEDMREHYRRCCVPEKAILGIAGYVEPERVVAQCEELFASWKGTLPATQESLEERETSGHIKHDSAQTHIGIAYPTVPIRHPDYYKAWACVSILSGGMSSRLFTKVREERGLCYAIGASMNSQRDRARVLCYAGTTNDRAQETLDVTLSELMNLAEDISPEELQRCKARAKSSLIMQQESTMARSSSLTRDWFHLDRLTTLEEIRGKVDALTVDDVRDFAVQHSARTFQVLTIGPEALRCEGQVNLSDL